ncbi:MAG: hypothetical protein NTZ48_04790, partial [Candidatus Omnitrophica bacterium]|nr:hypothetical protein [Candidatus Omnitrophota bacterium]
MAVDVVLISMPNKNIDYPSLSLPILTAALRQKGFTTEQLDINMVFRDEVLTEAGLTGLLEDSIPEYSKAFVHFEHGLLCLSKIYKHLQKLKVIYGFQSLEKVKKQVQARNYEWVFAKNDRFCQYLELFKINRALHNLIDIAATRLNPPANDYLSKVLNKTVNQVIEYVRRENPRIVGLSILEVQRTCSLILIKRLRSFYSGIIIVGGADPTRFPQQYIEQCKDIDVLFYREAEVSLPLFLESQDRNMSHHKSIPGIYTRDDEGNLVINDHKPVIMETDTPTPDFRGLPLNLYLTPALPVQASRGCSWQQCKFCIHWNTYGNFQTHSPKRVIEDINVLVSRHNTKYFHFTDDCLAVPQMRTLTNLFKKTSLDVRWLAYFRFEKDLDSELLKAIWDAGGRVLEMGLESASQRVLQLKERQLHPPAGHPESIT